MRTRTNVLCAAIAVVGGLALASTASAATWVGGSGTDWATAANWDTNAVPDASTSVTILALPGGTAVDVNSPTDTAWDFSMDSQTTDNLSLTIHSGATLTISTHNFDMGYTGNGGPSSGQVLVRVENGGTLNVPGYFIRARANPNTLFQLDGLVNAGDLYQDPSDSVHLNFGKTGVLVLSEVLNRQYSDTPVTGSGVPAAVNTLATDGHITVDGFGPSDPGWGTLYGLNTSYDPQTDKTTVTAFDVPEPASGALLVISLAGLMVRRKRQTV